MAYDIYLTIPGIPGDSMHRGFENTIEVYSYSWGLSETVNTQGGGQGAGKTQVSDFTILKRFDQSSPLLMQTLATGKRLPKITASLVRTGSNAQVFLTYEFDAVFVTSIQDSGSTGGDSAPTESISFAMEKVIVKYYPQTVTGALGTPIIFEYSLGNNG